MGVDDGAGDRRDRGDTWQANGMNRKEREEEMSLWGVFVFGLIGATATTYALRRSRMLPRGATGGFQEEARKRYYRRMQEEYEEEMERVERIKRMQSVFNRKRDNYKRNYESWMENAQNMYNQQNQREDWYWKTDASHRDHRSNFRETHRERATIILSHHYSILGLDRLRRQPYTDDEIKTAFRSKAMEFHPDQNQDNKEVAEAKFKEVMSSYEAIKKERKDNK